MKDSDNFLHVYLLHLIILLCHKVMKVHLLLQILQKNKTIIILQLILLKIECKLVLNVILYNIIPTQQVYNYSKQNCIN